MRRPGATGGLASWPWGFLGMLCLVAAAERHVARHDIDFTTPSAYDWKLTGKLAAQRGPRSRVLCFGDSLVKFGIAAPVLEQRLRQPVFNLALGAGHAPSSYFLLRRALRAGARPAAIIVDGEKILEDPLTLTRLWPELLTTREAFELAWTARDARFLATVLMSQALPSVRVRFEVRANVQAALRGELSSSRYVLRPFLRNWRVNQGSQIAPRRVDDIKAEIDRLARDYLPIGWHCNRLNAEYVRRLLNLAESRRIAVFWLVPPVCPQIQARREEGGADRDYMRYLRVLQQRHANLVVIDGRHSGYDWSVHSDVTHLDRVGVGVMSRDVAEIVAQTLHGPGPERWVPLPAYRSLPGSDALEDVAQSIVMCRAEGQEARR